MGRKTRARSSYRATARSGTRKPLSRRRAGEPAWLTVSQLARRWQLGRTTIYKIFDKGTLPVWKVGTHLFRIALADVLRFEARNRRYRKLSR